MRSLEYAMTNIVQHAVNADDVIAQCVWWALQRRVDVKLAIKQSATCCVRPCCAGSNEGSCPAVCMVDCKAGLQDSETSGAPVCLSVPRSM